jgi:hypothetical protein
MSHQLDQLIRSTLDERAAEAPHPAPVVTRVLAGRRRRRGRAGWLTVGAVATATAAVVAVGVTLVGGEDDGEGVASGPSGSFAQSRITYAEGSTIHYGDQTVDVAPHRVVGFVPTDDGFVFVDDKFVDGHVAVYFTNGEGVEQIGEMSGFSGDDVLASDETGSYAGWIDGDDAVVYDTADGAEVLREPLPDGVGEGYRSVAAIDGDSAYVQHADGVDVWNLTDHTKTTFSRANPGDALRDVAGGYLMWGTTNDSTVVSQDPQAEQPVIRGVIGMAEDHLSPDATYVSGSWQVVERESQADVTPTSGPDHSVILQWLDNDRYVADTDNILTAYGTPDRHDLLMCSVSAGTCEVAVKSLRAIVYPTGIVAEGGPWEG